MPTYRGTYFFNQFNQGWTETWYTPASDISVASGIFVINAKPLVAFRHVDTLLVGVRTTQVLPIAPRITRRFSLLYNGGRGTAGLAPLGVTSEDLVGSSALMLAQFSDNTSRPYMLRGLEDQDVIRDPITGAGTPSAGLNAGIATLAKSLVNLNLGGQRQDTTIPRQAVSSIQLSATPGQTQLFGPSNANFTVGDVVHFTGVPTVQTPWLKGKWSVIAVTANSISINYPYNLAAPVSPTSMFAQKVQYLYPGFLLWQFEDFRQRKTGRPTTLTRGRSRGIPFRRSIRVVG